MIVRKIAEKDVAPMVRLGGIMHRIGSFKKVKYSEDKVFKTIRASIDSDT